MKPVPEFEAIRSEVKAMGLDRMSMREIIQEIKRYRRERRNKLQKSRL